MYTYMYIYTYIIYILVSSYIIAHPLTTQWDVTELPLGVWVGAVAPGPLLSRERVATPVMVELAIREADRVESQEAVGREHLHVRPEGAVEAGRRDGVGADVPRPVRTVKAPRQVCHRERGCWLLVIGVSKSIATTKITSERVWTFDSAHS